MKPNESEIEGVLRRAPRPTPPADLKEKLLDGIPNLNKAAPITAHRHLAKPGGWLRRWWPVIVPAAVSCLCAVALAVQQLEIRDLKESLQRLTRNLPQAESTTAANPAPTGKAASVSDDPLVKEQEEIGRLKEQVSQLHAEIAALEKVQQENEVLRAKLVEPPTLSAEEVDAVNEARAKALSIHCVNNLKQIGLAVRLWAMDHADVSPPDMLSMSNELNTPKILVCPADTNRVPAKTWQSFTAANVSYQYLTPTDPSADTEPTRLMTICPIHGHIGLCDGSVQMEVAKKHPDWLKEIDGKLYMEHQ